MRKFLATLFILVLSFSASSQILEPVKWENEVKKTGDDTYDVIFKASIEDKWHLYSIDLPEGGPIPTSFEFSNEENKYELVGAVTESEPHSGFDPIFEMDVAYHDISATFVQKIKVLDSSLSKLTGDLIFQTCDDEKCIFPMATFEIAIPEAEAILDSGDQGLMLNPVQWTSEIRKIGKAEYQLLIHAAIDDTWHVYSTDPYQKELGPTDIAPNPTSLRVEADENVVLKGSLADMQEPRVSFDPIFEMDLAYFDTKASFSQIIELTDSAAKSVMVTLDYQTCDDKQCIFPSKDFTFYIPAANAPLVSALDVSRSLADSEDEEEGDTRGMLTIFIVAFFSGFAALLTPCVFPMIPLTVSFFTKQSKSKAAGIKNAILYGLFIITIYVLLGTVVTWIFGADALNALSTNVWFNIIFFVLLVVFAMSFLGAFEIVLPQSWANKADSKADKGGIVGIFFMALALAIVSFSCTGPIVGTLLVEAASSGGLAPVIGMLGFSLAIALPFALFAMFPGWLNSLPKSGGWLNTVKVVLGFLELALAFKFLSQADLVLQLHWLEREVFIAIWIAVFGTLALYLFGKIKLPHDSPLQFISVGRLMLGLVVLSFTVYMIPGLWGAPLNLISAFPPAQEYSESPYGVGFSKLGGGGADHSSLPDGGHLMAPHDILHFKDYDKGVAYAKEVGKPIMIDFTGHACVNCRKMEQNVWAKGKILPILKNEVVLISLYVDEKKELPNSEKYTSPETGKKIKTVGNKWSDLQITRYKANAQPYYILMDHNEKNLIKPVGYTPDVEEYKAWLKKGITAFK